MAGQGSSHNAMQHCVEERQEHRKELRKIFRFFSILCDLLFEKILLIHKAQLLSYMKLMDAPVGLVINFHMMKLKDGISRLIFAGADEEEIDF